MEGGSSGIGGYYYPANWNIVKDWRGELPFSPISLQYYTGQCWNFSIQECVRDIAYLEKHPLKEDISASEMRDWLPFLSSFFDMKAKPPAHSVNQYVWPRYDIGNGFGATVPEIFQYLKSFGTFFKSDYLYEQPLLGNNFTPFSMEQFHALRTTAPERVFIDTYRILEAEKAIPIIKTKHPAVGGLFSTYDNFVRYNYNRSLSPIKPVDTSGKSHGPDHMVYIVGYGFDKGKRIGDQDEDDDMDIGDEDEGTECFLIKNTWKSWGYEGYGMVPVKLFEHVAYPKGVNVRDSSTIINNDFHVAEAQRKYYGRF